MFVALDKFGQRVHAWEANRVEQCVCPECDVGVVLKQGRIVVPHFAHRPNSGCVYGKGESERHHEMKWQIGSLFSGQHVAYEVRFTPEHRADVVVGGWVVECQSSPLAVTEWEARTRFYNRQGKAMLWVWDEGRFQAVGIDEYRIPVEIRECHRMNYGTVYALGFDGELCAAHFSRVVRTSYYEYEGVDYDRTLKTIKYIDSVRIDPSRGFENSGPKGHRFANFVRGGWWKK